MQSGAAERDTLHGDLHALRDSIRRGHVAQNRDARTIETHLDSANRLGAYVLEMVSRGCATIISGVTRIPIRVTNVQEADMKWGIATYDAFADEWYGGGLPYDTEEEAVAEGEKQRKDIEIQQPTSSSGGSGSGGIQDRVYLVNELGIVRQL